MTRRRRTGYTRRIETRHFYASTTRRVGDAPTPRSPTRDGVDVAGRVGGIDDDRVFVVVGGGSGDEGMHDGDGDVHPSWKPLEVRASRSSRF